MANNAMARVVIVGGAIMGSFAAWFLRREGFAGDITVVEKDPTYQRCSTTLSAASIRTQFGTPVNIQMSLYGVDFLRGIKQTFGPTADIGYVERGYLILGGPDTVTARRAAVEMQRAGGADIVALTPDQIAARFPYLSVEDVGIGTFGETGEGWFDAWSLMSLVRGAAKDLGVRYVSAEVAAFDLAGGKVQAVRLAGGDSLPCDWCVMAAGAASGALTSALGQPLPVTPRKRTVFSFRAPLKAPGFPMLFDTSGIWTRPEGEGFIGGIQPPADQDPDATGDFEPHHHLMEDVFWHALAARVPAMEHLRLERSWAGHYEINELDHNGIVGPHDEIANLVFLTGFSGHGVMHAPAAGRGVAEFIVQGRFTSLDLSPLGYHRIRSGTPMPESIVY
ncbi:FAD-dependent oxidoreductase [Frigidibacter albus]|uniref:FAD-dependent oxidoreductase n=1 Tax=Frigidibacter albus TaxID=1465486 RepID=A0A6L8VG15_9RHOB|nr:FAD-binding oxidoreductase [Frigidibacter albus]MZQ89297.1 FAD-dependent oxidoreductase [Frigidibacter albus]NBE31203.1 FAD-dependent oxidoreductase [Frigidibacter albus]GGH53464.1 FAD-dependent oxidoreductase [Frigidibacter albus]